MTRQRTQARGKCESLNPRVYRGKIVAELLRKGWKPPPLTIEQADRLLHDMEYDMHPTADRHRRDTVGLTDRERMVLSLIAHGLTTNSVAGHLGRSAETVKEQMSSARTKLDARNTVNAVAIAVDQGIIHSASGWREAA